jgi:hypothetical protein
MWLELRGLSSLECRRVGDDAVTKVEYTSWAGGGNRADVTAAEKGSEPLAPVAMIAARWGTAVPPPPILPLLLAEAGATAPHRTAPTSVSSRCGSSRLVSIGCACVGTCASRRGDDADVIADTPNTVATAPRLPRRSLPPPRALTLALPGWGAAEAPPDEAGRIGGRSCAASAAPRPGTGAKLPPLSAAGVRS